MAMTMAATAIEQVMGLLMIRRMGFPECSWLPASHSARSEGLILVLYVIN